MLYNNLSAYTLCIYVKIKLNFYLYILSEIILRLYDYVHGHFE